MGINTNTWTTKGNTVIEIEIVIVIAMNSTNTSCSWAFIWLDGSVQFRLGWTSIRCP